MTKSELYPTSKLIHAFFYHKKYDYSFTTQKEVKKANFCDNLAFFTN